MQAMATEFKLPQTVFITLDKNQYLLRFFATKESFPYVVTALYVQRLFF